MRRNSIAIVTSISFASIACSSADSARNQSGNADDSARSDETSELPDGTPLLEPPSVGEGFQIHLEPFDVQPGEERYYCYRLPMPVDHDFDLGAVESRFSAGAHHLLLSTVDKFYEPAHGPCGAGEFGYEVPLRDAMQNNLRFLSGAQTPYSDDPRTRLDLDAGMAFQLRAETTVLVQLHWANTTTEVQRATTTINFFYPEEATNMPLDSFFFYHTDIGLRPQERSEVGGRCSFPPGVRIVSMVSHMHARGVDFTVHRSTDSTAPIYREDSWSEPRMKFWPSNNLLSLDADERVDYRCYFQNDTPEWIYAGDGADEEMCMLIGLYTGGTGTIWGFPGTDYPGNACTALPTSD